MQRQQRRTGPHTAPGGFNTHPLSVRAWVEALPAGNLAELGCRLLEAIRQVNGRNTAPAELFHFLEAIGPAAASAFGYLESRYAHRPLPFDAAGDSAAVLALELMTGLMRGYGAVLRRTRDGSVWPWRMFQSRQESAAALHRIFRYGERLMGIYRQIHLDPPHRFWQRIHRCYRLAETDALAAHRVKRLDDDRRKTSVEHEYKRLLLAAMLPSRIAPARRAEIRATMDQWVGLVALGRPADGLESADYAVQLTSDSGPRALARMDPDVLGGADTRLLHTGALKERLRPTGEASQPIPADAATLALLHDCWCVVQRRAEARVPLRLEAEVAVGLGALFRGAGGRPQATGRAAYSSGGSLGQLLENNGDAFAAQGEEDPVGVGQLLDRSEHGASLVIPDGSALCFAIGMPVAVRAKGEEWSVGTVMRLKRKGASVGLGVRFHLQGATPARLRTREGGRMSPAFDVVMGRARDRRWVVVAPAVASLRGGDAVLEVGGRSVRVDRGAALCHSPYVELFPVWAAVGKVAEAEPAAPPTAAAEGPMASSAEAPIPAESTDANEDEREARIRRVMETTGLSRSDSALIAEIETMAG